MDSMFDNFIHLNTFKIKSSKALCLCMQYINLLLIKNSDSICIGLTDDIYELEINNSNHITVIGDLSECNIDISKSRKINLMTNESHRQSENILEFIMNYTKYWKFVEIFT